MNILLAMIIAWKYHSGEAATTLAVAIGLLCLALLNAILIPRIFARYRRKGQGVSLSLIIGAAVLMLFTALIAFRTAHVVHERNEYLELALSDKPLSDIHPEQTELVVELVRSQLANSRANARLIAGIRPISPPLFSQNSFANESTIQSVFTEYKTATEADFAYYAQQQRALNEFRGKMTRVDPEYLKAFELAQQRREEAEAEAVKMEHESADTALALYQYASIHAKDIKITNGEFVFSNESVRTEFSRKFEASKASFSRLQKAIQEMSASQQLAPSIK